MKTISKRLTGHRALTKTLLRLVLGLSVLPSDAIADDRPAFGYIRLVNAVATGDGALRLSIDGVDVNPPGYRLGDITGGIGLSPGAHRISVEREGVETGKTTIRLAKDETLTLIPFAEILPRTDERPPRAVIRILRLNPGPPITTRDAVFVSVCQEPEIKVDLGTGNGWMDIRVQRLTTERRPLAERHGYVPLRVQGKDRPAMEVSSPGTYLVLLYEDPAGKVLTLNFPDLRYLSSD